MKKFTIEQIINFIVSVLTILFVLYILGFTMIFFILLVLVFSAGSIFIFISYIEYIFDAILLDVVRFILNKITFKNRFSSKNWYQKILYNKDYYKRYENPILIYLLFFIINLFVFSLLCTFFPTITELLLLLCAILINISFYFIGMYKRYRMDIEKYDNVLKNNIDCLKLFFLPLTFLITVVGFIFTVGGVIISIADIESVLAEMFFFNLEFEYETPLAIFILFIMNVLFQIFSYFIISSIYYLRKHGDAYKY